MFDTETSRQVQRLAGMVECARTTIVFTGAGISTESGIPDFCGPDGVWAKYNPEDYTYERYLKSYESRRLAWRRMRDSRIIDAQPNLAHRALTTLERLGRVQGIITQNVDGLHQKAGTSPDKVIELHGTSHWCVCLDCHARFSSRDIIQRVESGEEVPDCWLCGGMLKSAVISFGQPMPMDAVKRAERWSRTAQVFLVVGSSLAVYPAAGMPLLAHQAGARLAIVNTTETPLDSYADVVIRGKAGEVLTHITDVIRRRRSN